MTEEEARAALADRIANPPERVRDEELPAGSAMHFYCRSCGHLAGTLPEDYDPRFTPPPRYCPPCQQMIDRGWLTEEKPAKIDGPH